MSSLNTNKAYEVTAQVVRYKVRYTNDGSVLCCTVISKLTYTLSKCKLRVKDIALIRKSETERLDANKTLAELRVRDGDVLGVMVIAQENCIQGVGTSSGLNTDHALFTS